MGYDTNAKLTVGFSSRPWLDALKSNGSVFTDLPFQPTWESSLLQSGKAGLLISFAGGNHGLELGQGSEESPSFALVDQLERIVPGVRNAGTGMTQVRLHWPTHQWTRRSCAGYLPGQWTGLRGEEGTNVGRLYFAGEHCSLNAQGFMEGGCETGPAVTRAMLA